MVDYTPPTISKRNSKIKSIEFEAILNRSKKCIKLDVDSISLTKRYDKIIVQDNVTLQ